MFSWASTSLYLLPDAEALSNDLLHRLRYEYKDSFISLGRLAVTLVWAIIAFARVDSLLPNQFLARVGTLR